MPFLLMKTAAVGAAAAATAPIKWSYRATAPGEVCSATAPKLCGMTGNVNWGNAYPACKGKEQSPVDLISKNQEKATNTHQISVYGPDSDQCGSKVDGTTCSWKHAITSHGVEWTPTNCRFCAKRDGKLYHMAQCHMHGPSEHAINGVRSALEIHCVHVLEGSKAPNNLLVIGTMLNGGDQTNVPGINASLESSFNKLQQKAETKDIKYSFYPATFQANSQSFFHYPGSLTTPGCTEGQHWYVADKIYNVKKAVVDQFRAFMKKQAAAKQMVTKKDSTLQFLSSVIPPLADDDLLSARVLMPMNDRKLYHQAFATVVATGLMMLFW